MKAPSDRQHKRPNYFPKTIHLSKRRFRPLIPVENGTYMLLSRAKEKVAAGLARIVNGRVRFINPTDAGYERAAGYARFGGSMSYDPELSGGPTTIQFFRTNKGRRT